MIPMKTEVKYEREEIKGRGIRRGKRRGGEEMGGEENGKKTPQGGLTSCISI